MKRCLLVLVAVVICATLTISSESNQVVIHAFDQNPAGTDEGNEWLVLYNPADTTIDVSSWTLSTTHGTTVNITIPQGTSIPANEYWRYTHDAQWLDNSEDLIILRNAEGQEIDRTIVANDGFSDNRYWVRDPDGVYIGSTSKWSFRLQDLEEDISRNGTCVHVVDGDTLDISPVGIAGIQRIRLVGIDTPEEGEDGYDEAKKFTIDMCIGKNVEFDIDDEEQYDSDGRWLAVIHTGGLNLNAELLCQGYAEILYIPPSEFNPDGWCADCSTTTTTTTISQECEIKGDTQPCGEISLSEVIDFITLWASDNATLSEVIELINVWAAG